MTKEEIEKEIAEIKIEMDGNIEAIMKDRDNLKRLIDEFAHNAIMLASSYAKEVIDKLNKLLEATNESDNH